MTTNKVSRTIAEQIALLKSRGMLIKDEQMAALYLSHISYYRLKGYWWDMQMDRTHHVFAPNSCFENVIAHYNFDRQLRLILFDAIEFKSICRHVISFAVPQKIKLYDNTNYLYLCAMIFLYHEKKSYCIRKVL